MFSRMRPEDMRVYQVAAELAAEVDLLLPLLPRWVWVLAGHLVRSTESVGLNLMEGLVAFKPKVKATAFDIARKEAAEVRKILKRLVARKVLTEAQIQRAYELAGSLIGMLTVMIKQQEQRTI